MYNRFDSEKYPKRKNPRLKNHDYSSNNYYFVTICTHERKCLFGRPGKLSSYGIWAQQGLLEIPRHYPDFTLDAFVVMPNHVHAILIGGGRSDLCRAVGSFKSYVTKKVHATEPDRIVWQASFHDHIIRNQHSYQNIWLYIQGNPLNWEKDCFFLNEDPASSQQIR